MSQISSMFGHLPGLGTLVETFEQAYCWGPYPRYWTGAYIGANATDAGNNPSSTLRVGLVMGKQTSTGQWLNYSPTATDGSQIAAGVLPLSLRMQDVLTEQNTSRFYAMMVSGGVKAANLIGLDQMAREQMAGLFIFDDFLPPNHYFPWISVLNKTANYAIQSTDNNTLFTNTGAAGEVDLTLPPIANGYCFGLKATAAQVLKFISFEGGNLVGSTATQSSVSVTAIGGGVTVFSNPGATQWIVVNESSYNQVVSFL